MDRDLSRSAVQRFYDVEAAYMTSDARDFRPVAQTLCEDILLCEPASLPYGGEYRGHAEFERWLRAFADVWSTLEVRDSEMIVAGDHVFSRSHVYARVRATGEQVDWPLLQFFRVQDGRVAELRPFHWDTARMMPALAKAKASQASTRPPASTHSPRRR